MFHKAITSKVRGFCSECHWLFTDKQVRYQVKARDRVKAEYCEFCYFGDEARIAIVPPLSSFSNLNTLTKNAAGKGE